MVKRKIKRKVRRAIFGVLILASIIFVIVLLGFSFKNMTSLFKIGIGQENSIIKPVGAVATKNDLLKALNDKNLIMESLVESSSSGIFIGRIKDGPKVYFSRIRDAKWQVLSLGLILNKLSVDNKKPLLIDLRFEQPIVKF